MTRIRVFASPDTRREAVTWLAALVLLAGVGLFLLRAYAPSLSDPQSVRTLILGYGPLAPLVFFLLQATQVVLAPIPGQVLGLVAGYLFGPLLGTVYSVAGATVGSWIAFSLSRRYGRSYVEKVVDETFLANFDALATEQGYLALLLAFLIPGLPDDAICFVAGLTDMRIERMVLISLVGRIPGYFLVALVGAGLASQRLVESMLLLLALLAVSLACYLRRDAILDWFDRRHGVE